MSTPQQSESSATSHVLTFQAGLRLTGRSTLADGRRISLEVALTNEGSLRGSANASGATAEILATWGHYFIRPESQFCVIAQHPTELAGRWIGVPSDTFGVDFFGLLSPLALSNLLDLTAWYDNADLGPMVTVGETPARQLSTPFVTVYFSIGEPRRLLRVEFPPVVAVEPDGYLVGKFSPVPTSRPFQFDCAWLEGWHDVYATVFGELSGMYRGAVVLGGERGYHDVSPADVLKLLVELSHEQFRQLHLEQQRTQLERKPKRTD